MRERVEMRLSSFQGNGRGERRRRRGGGVECLKKKSLVLKEYYTRKNKKKTMLIHCTHNPIHGTELQTGSHKFIWYSQKILKFVLQRIIVLKRDKCKSVLQCALSLAEGVCLKKIQFSSTSLKKNHIISC